MTITRCPHEKRFERPGAKNDCAACDADDAERYRWLKKVAAFQLAAIAWGHSKEACQYGEEDQVDLAVDVARKATSAATGRT